MIQSSDHCGRDRTEDTCPYEPELIPTKDIGVTDEQKQPLDDLTFRFSHCFALNPKQLTTSSKVEHRNETRTAMSGHYHVSPDEKQNITHEMTRNGIRRESKSPWTAGIIMAPSKDVYPLPRTDECPSLLIYLDDFIILNI